MTVPNTTGRRDWWPFIDRLAQHPQVRRTILKAARDRTAPCYVDVIRLIALHADRDAPTSWWARVGRRLESMSEAERRLLPQAGIAELMRVLKPEDEDETGACS